MSRIDEMIARLCPDGVEYKALGEVGVFTRGSGIQKKDFVDEGEPCIHYGQIYTYYGISADKTKSYIAKKLYEGRKKANTGNLVIATTSENEEDVCKCVAWLGEKPCAVSGDAYIFSHSQNPKYIAYLFQSERFQEQKKRYITGTKVLRVSGDNMARIVLPIPPLEIQEEIVRILDSFAKLEAELEAELEARKAQYAYYRDQLLSFTERECSWLKLGDVGTFTRGSGIQKKDFMDEGEPCIHYGQIYTRFGMVTDKALSLISEEQYGRAKKAQSGDIIIAITSENVEDVCTPLVWEGDSPVAISGHSCAYHTKLNSRYVAYYMGTEYFFKQKKKIARGTKVIEVKPSDLAYMKIPVPSLAEQQRIVDILDKFDALTTSLTDGLPAEIEARRQQYEYYRDRLLDFPRKRV